MIVESCDRFMPGGTFQMEKLFYNSKKSSCLVQGKINKKQPDGYGKRRGNRYGADRDIFYQPPIVYSSRMCNAFAVVYGAYLT